MIKFILNEHTVSTDVHPGITVLDFIRYHKRLMGTKIGCREGDCGACTVLVGETVNEKLSYHSVTSCLMPLGNAAGKHIVTIEGINAHDLTPVQEAFANEGATQCGFCTPGFIVSLTGYCISEKTPGYHSAIDAMNGNICRCTGYKSIERAAKTITDNLQQRKQPALDYAIAQKIVPAYFRDIPKRLELLGTPINEKNAVARKMGGGTDLYVQQHDRLHHEDLNFLRQDDELNKITRLQDTCYMGAAVTVSQLAESAVFKNAFANWGHYIKLVSSTQIRNMATVAGNFINASPIGDFTILFLALQTQIKLNNAGADRILPLQQLYLGYKKLNKEPEEIITEIIFKLPGRNDLFNFEKVSKRTHLDIASVNSAMHIQMNAGKIVYAALSAGGVGPVPAYLSKSSDFLKDKEASIDTLRALLKMVQSEISPISDARGQADYKRLLLAQLVKAHFITFFPGLPVDKIVALPA